MGSSGQTDRKSRAAHSKCSVPRGRLPGRWGGHQSPRQRAKNRPCAPGDSGRGGPTLPPPTGPRSPPWPGALAAGRAGTAAGAPGPEASGRLQPWLGLGLGLARGSPASGAATQAQPSARREGGARRGAGPRKCRLRRQGAHLPAYLSSRSQGIFSNE